MNEERYGYRLRQALNHGLLDISPAASRRLEAARHMALSRQKQTSPALASATYGQHNTLRLSGPGQHPYLRQALAIMALLLGMWISFYWHSQQYVSEVETIDSALLADDLPFEAFLDKDFLEWLKDDSAE
jgi:hypothetical protein